MKSLWKRSRMMNALTAAFAFGILSSASLSAAAMAISAGSVSAAPGSSRNSLDVDLINLGPSALTIGGFSFKLSVLNTNISLTDVNTFTASTYIFFGNSLFGPDLSGPNSGQSISASDVVFIPSTGTTITSGKTVALGHVLFDVSSHAAPGTVAVNFAAFPNTTLSGALGNDVSIDTLSPGQITITGQIPVPEPSSLLTVLLSLIAVASITSLRLGRC